MRIASPLNHGSRVSGLSVAIDLARRGRRRGGSPTRASPSSGTSVRSTSTSSCEVDVDAASPAGDHERPVEPAGAGAERPSRRERVALDRRPARPRREPDPRPTRRAGGPRGRSRRASAARPRSGGPRRSGPTEPSAFATSRTRPHSSRAGRRRRQRAGLSQRVERGVREGGLRVERRGIGGDLLEHVTDGDDGHAACTTPGWNSGFPTGIGTGQAGVSGPGSRPWLARAFDQRPDQLRGRLRASPAARPRRRRHARARSRRASSCERRRASSSALSPRQSCVSLRPPDDLSARAARASSGVKSARCPQGIRHRVGVTPALAARPAPGPDPASTSSRVACGCRRCSYPCTSTPCPSPAIRASSVRVLLDPLAEHEERRRHAAPRAHPAPRESPAGPAHHRTSAPANARCDATQIAARLTVAWWA